MITLHRVAVGRDTAVVPNPRDTIVTSADVVRPVRPAAGSEDIRRTSIENVAMNVASSDSFAIQQAMGAVLQRLQRLHDHGAFDTAAGNRALDIPRPADGQLRIAARSA